MAVKNEKKGIHLSISSGAVALGLTLLGAVLFFMSYRTGYYIFGEMKSSTITAFIVLSILFEIAMLFASYKYEQSMVTKLLPFCVTALLAASAMLLVGDRVEGIGNCIVSDYDSGHGGEEAIYMSLVGAVCFLTAMVYNIIGAFTVNGSAPATKNKNLAMVFSGAALGVAAIVAAVMLVSGGSAGTSGKTGGGGAASGPMTSGEFKITFNQANENVDAETMPDFQFLSANMGGLCRADARFYVDVVLNLDGAGGYTLTSDSYVIDSGKRVEIGDASGLGLVYKTTSEGTYTDNGDGTVTTSAASHVKFEIHTDTYSEQMKSMMMIDIDGGDADGDYDSAEHPEVLSYVPGALFTLSDGAITTYCKPGLAGEFKITFNQANGNTDADVMPTHQFLSANMGGLCRADARFYIDIVLNLDGAGGYKLSSDAYVIDSGKRAEIGDPSGLGLVYKTTSEGTYTDNGDGTVTTTPATHVLFELKTDTYSEQMKSMMHIDLGGSDADGEYDSADYPVLIDYIPETIWTLDSAGTVVTYKGTEEEEGEEGSGEETAAASADAVTITSDDGATTITFNPDGTYVFKFESYGIEDAGTWTYEGGKLVLTNANGDTAEAEGDPLKLHYVTAVSADLAGDYTIPAASLNFEAASAGGESAGEPLVVTSDDGGTTMTFNPDGTYVFAFESYGISDLGTWTYDGTKLVVTNKNGDVAEAEGDPLKLHYVSSVSADLAGDYTINAADLTFENAAGSSSGEPVTVTSDDGGTTMTFNPDGTYVFKFESYGIEDPGTWTYDGTRLVVTNKNGDVAEAEGDPLKLHYVTAVSADLTGDYTINAADLA